MSTQLERETVSNYARVYYYNEKFNVDLEKLQNMLDRDDTLTEKALVYVVGHNMPGCLPDNKPYALATAQSAVDALIEELETRAFDCQGTAEEAEALHAIKVLKHINTDDMQSDVELTVGNYIYWIDIVCVADIYIPDRREQ